MSPVYRSPSSGSAAAATTPARLAQEFHGATLWRTAPTGETEVVTLRDGILERYVVHEDGSASLLESSSQPFGYRWGLRALVVGAVLAIGAGIAMGALGEPKLVLVALVGMALFAGGGLARGRADDLRSRAEEAHGGKGEWHLPTKLRGWMPRTAW